MKAFFEYEFRAMNFNPPLPPEKQMRFCSKRVCPVHYFSSMKNKCDSALKESVPFIIFLQWQRGIDYMQEWVKENSFETRMNPFLYLAMEVTGDVRGDESCRSRWMVGRWKSSGSWRKVPSSSFASSSPSDMIRALVSPSPWAPWAMLSPPCR